jgi:hypothetical protein
MASCVKCGKPIGLIEYTLGESKQVGLCKSCRTTEKWCDDCVYMLTITMEDSAVNRCIKYGYDLSKKKDWKTAANCQDYTPKIIEKNPKQKKNNKNKTKTGVNKRTIPKRKTPETNGWF